MILGKFGTAIAALFNSIANAFWARNPEAILQLEVDRAIEAITEARKGLELQRGFVERTARQVAHGKAREAGLLAEIKGYLGSGNRDMAAQKAAELNEVRKDLAENVAQNDLHEKSYQNFLLKVQHGTKNVGKLQERAQKLSADLKMSKAEVEIAHVAEALDTKLSGVGNITSNIGKIENIIQGQIDHNRGKVRVSADLSSTGVEEIRARQESEKYEAEDLLRGIEAEMGLVSPESARIQPVADRVVGTEGAKVTS